MKIKKKRGNKIVLFVTKEEWNVNNHVSWFGINDFGNRSAIVFNNSNHLTSDNT